MIRMYHGQCYPGNPNGDLWLGVVSGLKKGRLPFVVQSRFLEFGRIPDFLSTCTAFFSYKDVSTPCIRYPETFPIEPVNWSKDSSCALVETVWFYNVWKGCGLFLITSNQNVGLRVIQGLSKAYLRVIPSTGREEGKLIPGWGMLEGW